MLPPRFLAQEQAKQDPINQIPPIDQLLNDYYDYREWSKNGIPTAKKLEDLKL
jgi:aldehyde:ferredoxin oxidoreductase